MKTSGRFTPMTLGASIAGAFLVASCSPAAPIETMTIDGKLYQPRVWYTVSSEIREVAVDRGRIFWIEPDHGWFLKSIDMTKGGRPEVWGEVDWDSRLVSASDGLVAQTCEGALGDPRAARFWRVTLDGLREVTAELWRDSSPTCAIGRGGGFNAGFAIDKYGFYWSITSKGLARSTFGTEPQAVIGLQPLGAMVRNPVTIRLIGMNEDGALYYIHYPSDRTMEVYRLTPPYDRNDNTLVLSYPMIYGATLDPQGGLLAGVLFPTPLSTPPPKGQFGQFGLVKVSPDLAREIRLLRSGTLRVNGIALDDQGDVFVVFVEATDCPLPGCHGYRTRIVEYTPKGN